MYASKYGIGVGYRDTDIEATTSDGVEENLVHIIWGGGRDAFRVVGTMHACRMCNATQWALIPNVLLKTRATIVIALFI